MLEWEDEIWLSNSAFLVDLTALLNELNMSLRGENQLICAVFQTIIVFKMKSKLWQAQVMAKNFIHFAMLSKHSSVNNKKSASLPSMLIKDLRIGFKV